MAQRRVNTFVQDVCERVSADPFGDSTLPDLRLRLTELRGEVDAAAEALTEALVRMGKASQADPDREMDKASNGD